MINGEIVVDNFAGGGGASTGIELATGYSVDIAINHDPEAIKMHKANHPSTKHYCESVWDVDPIDACKKHKVALAPKTMERIARGLKKFVINNQEPFIVQCKSQDIKNTLRKITTENQPCVISPTLIQYHSETTDNGVRGQAIEEPIMTVDSSNRYGLVSVFLQKYISGGYKWNGKSLEEPLPAVTSINHNSICTSHIIQMNNHCDGNDIENPIHTIDLDL